MTSGSPSIETISHRVITGSPEVSRIEVDGWGAQYNGASYKRNDWSDDGRLWCVNDSGTLKVYKRIQPDGTFDSGDEVMSGTIAANGDVPLTQSNTSGLSGNLQLDNTSDGDKFDLIVTYGDERDIEQIHNVDDMASALDSPITTVEAKSGRWQETLLEAKRRLDDWLVAAHGRQKFLSPVSAGRETWPFKLDARKRWELASLASPKQIARVHAYYALAVLCERRAPFNKTFQRLYDFYMKRAHEDLKKIRIIIDHDPNQTVDAEADTGNPDRQLERA